MSAGTTFATAMYSPGMGRNDDTLADEDAIAMFVSDVNNLHTFIKGMIHGSEAHTNVRSPELMLGMREACRVIQAYLVRAGCPVPRDLCVNCEKPTEHGPGSLCDPCLRLG